MVVRWLYGSRRANQGVLIINHTIYEKVLRVYADNGIDEALTIFMKELQGTYGKAHFTVLSQKQVFSTIKNEDDREFVRDNFFTWKHGETGEIRNRIQGLHTLYYPLQGEYNGRTVMAAVLIAEIPEDHLDTGIISLFSMLAVLRLKKERQRMIDELTGLCCGDSLLQEVHKRADGCCVIMIRYRCVHQTSIEHGWIAGGDKLLKCIQDWKSFESVYSINRDTIAIVTDTNISDTYSIIYKRYGKLIEKPDILIAEVVNAPTWDRLGSMDKELNNIHGVSIMRSEAMRAKESGQVDLFSVMGIPYPEDDSYSLESMISTEVKD